MLLLVASLFLKSEKPLMVFWWHRFRRGVKIKFYFIWGARVGRNHATRKIGLEHPLYLTLNTFPGDIIDDVIN